MLTWREGDGERREDYRENRLLCRNPRENSDKTILPRRCSLEVLSQVLVHVTHQPLLAWHERDEGGIANERKAVDLFVMSNRPLETLEKF